MKERERIHLHVFNLVVVVVIIVVLENNNKKWGVRYGMLSFFLSFTYSLK